eukprot:s142_g11.t1
MGLAMTVSMKMTMTVSMKMTMTMSMKKTMAMMMPMTMAMMNKMTNKMTVMMNMTMAVTKKMTPMTMAMMNKMTNKMTVMMNMTMAVTKKMTTKIAMTMASTAFSKTLMSEGTATIQDNLVAGQYLQVNLRAPGVLAEDGSLTVQCALDQVVSMPRQLEEMIPRLDERAAWGHFRSLEIFDFASGECLRCFEGHGDHVYTACFSPSCKQVLTASEDATAKIFDI